MQALGRCVVGETCKTPSILEAQEEERVILAGQYYLVSFHCLVLRRLGPPQLPRKISRYRSLHRYSATKRVSDPTFASPQPSKEMQSATRQRHGPYRPVYQNWLPAPLWRPRDSRPEFLHVIHPRLKYCSDQLSRLSARQLRLGASDFNLHFLGRALLGHRYLEL